MKYFTEMLRPPTYPELLSELYATLESLEAYSKSPFVKETAKERREELSRIYMKGSTPTLEKSVRTFYTRTA